MPNHYYSNFYRGLVDPDPPDRRPSMGVAGMAFYDSDRPRTELRRIPEEFVRDEKDLPEIRNQPESFLAKLVERIPGGEGVVDFFRKSREDPHPLVDIASRLEPAVRASMMPVMPGSVVGPAGVRAGVKAIAPRVAQRAGPPRPMARAGGVLPEETAPGLEAMRAIMGFDDPTLMFGFSHPTLEWLSGIAKAGSAGYLLAEAASERQREEANRRRAELGLPPLER